MKMIKFAKMDRKIVAYAGALISALLFLGCAYSALGYPVRWRPLLVGLVLLLLVRATSKRVYAIWCLLLGLVALCYAPAGVMYGSPNANTLIAFTGTNVGEATEFLALMPYSVWLTQLALILSGLLLWRMSSRLPSPKAKTLTILTIVAAVVAFSTFGKNLIKGIDLHPQQVNANEWCFAHSLYTAFRDRSQVKAALGSVAVTPNWGEVTRTKRSPDVVVLVIGESVRRDFMGFYNKAFKNTPWMSSTPGIDFADYVSPFGSTAGALTRILFLLSDKDHAASTNVVTLMKAAGYRTAWLSVQGDGDQLNSPASMAAWRADEKYLPRRGLIAESDETLLPRLDSALSHNKGPQFIVLHLMGSHPRACRRTNDQYDVFYESEELSCYVQSIRNTDALLAKVAERLKQTGESWSLTYLADHGLRLERDREGAALRHDDDDKMNYSPPFFFTASDLKQPKSVTAARNGRNFLPIFATLNGIDVKRFHDQTCNWLSDEVCPDQNRVTNYKGQDLDVTKLPVHTLKDL